MENLNKLCAVFWYLVEDRELNRTVINKLLFFIDAINFYKNNSMITNVDYVKMPYGPVPRLIHIARKALVSNGLVKEDFYFMGTYNEYRYGKISGSKEKILKTLSPTEWGIVDKVKNTLVNKSAGCLSKLSHEFQPWLDANWEEVIDFKCLKDDAKFKGWLESLQLD